MHRLTLLFCLALGLLLTGCASTVAIHSQVMAVATAPAGLPLQGAKYRFERLPLQAHNPEAGLAEQQAEQALTAVGLVRDDAQAQLSVLVGIGSTQFLPEAAGRFGAYAGRPYGAFGFARPGTWGYQMGWTLPPPPPPQYRREVSLLLRDLRSGQVVYETHASHAGTWHNSEAVFATLFKAALAHFPNPPAGVQRVHIDIPR